jgi:hypothetical protein
LQRVLARVLLAVGQEVLLRSSGLGVAYTKCFLLVAGALAHTEREPCWGVAEVARPAHAMFWAPRQWQHHSSNAPSGPGPCGMLLSPGAALLQVFGYSPDETAYCRLILYKVSTPDAMVSGTDVGCTCAACC